jgi:phosphatidylglycerol lysyltransferase
VGSPLSLHRVAFSSIISYGLSQTLGFPLVTGGSIRYRFWTQWGLSTTEIAGAISFVGATFVVGIVFLSGAAFVAEPVGTMKLLELPVVLLRLAGVALLVSVSAYLTWSLLNKSSIRVRGWEFPTPSVDLALAQLIIATVDWAVAAAVLYALLPDQNAFGFPAFLGAFLLAQFAGQLSHVPGGVGVFETLMLLFLDPHIPPATGIAVLVAYRAIYYLVPFGITLLMLATYEVLQQRKRIVTVASSAGALAARWAPSILPQAMSAVVFLGGVILLFSGATPGVRDRLAQLDQALPLGLIEFFHFAGGIAGASLVVLAWGIQRRLDAAHRLTVGVLLLGIVASLFKGLDWEEALILAVILGVVWSAHGAFYRKAALLSEPIGPAWIVSLTVVMGATIWLGFFSYKSLPYSSDLWFHFTRNGDAPRFLRATLGAFGVLVVFAMMRLMRHAEAEPVSPDDAEIGRARKIVLHSSSTTANLVLLRDKSIMFSNSGNSMLMYGVSGRSWIALGDPVGLKNEIGELAWRFREEADRHGAWTVFYQVKPENLPVYIDLGLTLLKLGEEAIVPLDSFDLAGGARKGFRRTLNEVGRSGAMFSVVDGDCVAQLIPQLRTVSDNWLKTRKAREKGFSLGAFSDEYVAQFPVAVVTCDDRVAAFANLWTTANRSEISVDLMRYSSNAPTSVMEFLLIELMLWAKERGYHRFNLGMAPLSGLVNRTLAPLWNRAASVVYSQGEQFYNFQGLRRYKEKFDPVWEPRYLASPGGLALPRILANTTALISGGLRGVISS